MSEPGRDGAPSARKRPTVALFAVDQQSDHLLTECFNQHGVDVLAAEDLEIFRREKVEGCIVSLSSPNTEKVVEQARNLPWQKRMVIYAVGPAANMLGLTKYGINVVLDTPVSRPAAVKAIRGTRLLLFNELRRYVRLPLATPVSVDYGSQLYNATSLEVSAGGMSLEYRQSCPPNNVGVSVSFAVPGAAKVSVPANVCWIDRTSNQFGVRFEAESQGREPIKAWIEDYLGI
jgi:hypothetical protein